MKIEGYPLKIIDKKKGGLEQEPDVPIIDFVRHAETEYKQGEYKKERDGSYKRELLDTSSTGFALDSEHMDLNTEGITTMQETARVLLGMVDKEKEVILIVSSPSQRTHSSALIVDKIFRENGVNILNGAGDFRFFESLNETFSRMDNIEDDYIKEGGNKNTKEGMSAIEDKRRKVEASIFLKFLRHMNNIYDYLKPETLEKLKGKRLRIVCFTHAEITRNFIRETFNIPIDEKAQGNSQILEIVPESKLEENKEINTDMRLYPTAKRSGKETQVLRNFIPKK